VVGRLGLPKVSSRSISRARAASRCGYRARATGRRATSVWDSSSVSPPTSRRSAFPRRRPELIAAGCTVNRTSWTDHAGKARTDAGLGDLDDACYFSSARPTATASNKPEISAPGVLVAAAMSHDATPAAQGGRSIFAATSDVCPDDAGCYATDATHGLLSGSSMSSPQVTGAVALLLERDRGLSESDVRDLLMQGARFPSGYAPLDYQVRGRRARHRRDDGCARGPNDADVARGRSKEELDGPVRVVCASRSHVGARGQRPAPCGGWSCR